MWLNLLLIILSMMELAAMNTDSKVIGSHEPVHVRVGDDAILPCRLEPPFNVTTLTIVWKYNEKDVYLYRSRKPELVTQDENFKGRTSLFHEEMEKGNISLKVTNVTEVHAGNYTCFVPQLESQVRKEKVILIVDPVEKSKNGSQIDSGNGGMSSGAVAAIAVVVGCAAFIAVGVGFKLRKRGVNNQRNTSNTNEEAIEMEERRNLNTDGDRGECSVNIPGSDQVNLPHDLSS